MNPSSHFSFFHWIEVSAHLREDNDDPEPLAIQKKLSLSPRLPKRINIEEAVR